MAMPSTDPGGGVCHGSCSFLYNQLSLPQMWSEGRTGTFLYKRKEKKKKSVLSFSSGSFVSLEAVGLTQKTTPLNMCAHTCACTHTRTWDTADLGLHYSPCRPGLNLIAQTETMASSPSLFSPICSSLYELCSGRTGSFVSQITLGWPLAFHGL